MKLLLEHEEGLTHGKVYDNRTLFRCHKFGFGNALLAAILEVCCKWQQCRGTMAAHTWLMAVRWIFVQIGWTGHGRSS